MKEGNWKHPYAGKVAVLATKHGKEQQIAQPLYDAVGLQVRVPHHIDTNILGTFTGELPRQGPPELVVLQKARLGMELTGCQLGLANEGSFGPHPAMPFLTADIELLIFVDDERGIQVLESLVSEQAVAVNCAVHSMTELEPFLVRAHFPSHGLIVRPQGLLQADLIFKGITDVTVLAELVERCVDISPDGLALVETDLRAHMNPTRQAIIHRLAVRLGERLAHQCPQCATPGWGRVDFVRGLPCEWCGEPTELVREEVLGCPLCSYQQTTPRLDGLTTAPAAQCPICNP